MDIQYVLRTSEYYPTEWNGLKNPPERLYYVGDITLLKTRKITVVGSRKTPVGACRTGKAICKELATVFTIVTGTADGGDCAAAEGALAGGGKVICVLAGGFDTLPQNNSALLNSVIQKGLLLSPYPPETAVRTFSYEYRNKLLALLGEGTFVLGADEKSGALITAKYAIKEEKPVFALPYSPGTVCGVGCNELIKKGAYLTECATDIWTPFGIKQVQRKSATVLNADEERTYRALKELGETHVSALTERANIPPYKIRAVLSSLEVKGLAASLGGNRYAPL